jgi:hypothetical protein
MSKEYDIEIEMILNNFNCEYFNCGSHKMIVKAEMDLEELQELYNRIKKIEGIKI